jgi:hypothetical protein
MLGRGEPDEAKIAQFKEELVPNLDVYEKILSKQPYMAGQVRKKPLSIISFFFLLSIIIDIYHGGLISFAFWRITVQNG